LFFPLCLLLPFVVIINFNDFLIAINNDYFVDV